MTLLNIDQQPQAVKQFFEKLILTREGSVVEMDGRPVARMLPASMRAVEWTDARNARRGDLIDREIAGTISPNESLELELLQEAMQSYVEQSAPLPMDYALRLRKELLANSAMAEGSP